MWLLATNVGAQGLPRWARDLEEGQNRDGPLGSTGREIHGSARERHGPGFPRGGPGLGSMSPQESRLPPLPEGPEVEALAPSNRAKGTPGVASLHSQ